MRIPKSTIHTREAVTLLLLLSSTVASAQEENMETILDVPHVLAYIVAALLIGIFVMIFYNQLFIFREREVNARGRTANMRLALALQSEKIKVWTFDPAERIYRMLSDQGLGETAYTPIDFSHFYDRDDFEQMRKVVFDVRDRKARTGSAMVKSSGEDGQHLIYEISISVLRSDRQGRVRQLLGIQRDITATQQKHEEEQQMLVRYQTVFNSSVVDMLYYNADGLLTDINDKACETFHIKSRTEALSRDTYINDIPPFRNLNINALDNMRASSITPVAELQQAGLLPAGVPPEGNLYYEASVSPIRDKEGRLEGIFTAGRNITDMVLANHQQKEGARLLKQATADIENYIGNINYALKASKVRLMNYYPDTHEMEISNDLNTTLYRLSPIRCISLVDESDRRRARGILRRMDRRQEGDFSQTVLTHIRDSKGRHVCLSFNVIPIHDSKGVITHYFGMFRDETEMVNTERQLKAETKKARETELLKDSFLLNMSYEIRTPLNAVLGFAELFETDHNPDDEPLFVEEIKKNSGLLLELVNDVLFLSRLDAHMIELNYGDSDFPTIFDGYCHMGWSKVRPGVKVIVDNPYEHLLVNIDEQNLGKVITKLCTQAAFYTHEGYIRAKYEYRRGELTIAIEDSGRGIDEQALATIFERFSHNRDGEQCGTGLDMPIVKELVDQMHGTIDVQSEEDKGTSVWITIPCEAKTIERKEITL